MDAQEAKKRMEEGRLYYPNEEGITKYQFAAMEAMYEYNATHAMETEKRAELLKKCWQRWAKTAILKRHFMPTGAAAMYTLETMFTSTFI